MAPVPATPPGTEVRSTHVKHGPATSNASPPRVRFGTGPLSSPTFRTLWTGSWLWYSIRSMELAVLSWLVLELTNSPARVALVGTVRMAPMVVFGLFAGMIADRVERLDLLLVTQLINIVVSSLFLAALFAGVVTPSHAYLMIGTTGSTWAFDFSARRSYFASTLRRRHVAHGVSLDTAALTGAFMIGPVIAGTTTQLLGTAGGFAVVWLCHVLGVLILLRVRVLGKRRKATRSAPSAPPVWRSLGAIGRDPTVAGVLLVTVLVNIFGFPYLTVVSVVARNHLGVGSALYGLLMSAAGIGAFTASSVLAGGPGRRPSERLYLLGSGLLLVGIGAFAASPWYPTSLVALLIAGFGFGGFGVMQVALILSRVSQETRGSAMGALSLAIGAQPIGIWTLGNLAEATDVRTSLFLFAAAGLVALSVVAMVHPAFRGRSVRPRVANGSLESSDER